MVERKDQEFSELREGLLDEEESDDWMEPLENFMSERENDDGDRSTNLTPSPPLSRIGVNTDKAGMEGLDKSKINQIIVEASKGSKYYKKELERDRVLSQRIKKMTKQLRQFTKSEVHKAEQESDIQLEHLETRRDMSRVIVHIDMDAFFAAVEIRDNPALKDVPMAVGSTSMLSTSNYHARKFGVRAAMPGFIGKKLCPNLVIVKSNYNKYQQVAEEVRSILKEYDPDFCPMGVDESYLDITEYVNEIMTGTRTSPQITSIGMSQDETGTGMSLDKTGTGMKLDESSTGMSTNVDTQSSSLDQVSVQPDNQSVTNDCPNSKDPVQNSCDTVTHSECDQLFVGSEYHQCAQRIVFEIRHRIQLKTSLTASAGIAPNKMLAKISSNFNKPNGQYFLEPSRDKVMEFVRKLPIRKVCGIGKVTEKMLNALGVENGNDLYEKRGVLKLLFSETSIQNFFKIALGIGSTEVNNYWERKSLSTERTFSDTSSPQELLEKCSVLCQSLAKDVAEENIKSRTVTLKIKTSSFEVKQRSHTVTQPISAYNDIHQIAQGLVLSEIKACSPSPLCLRLMGVRLSGLERLCSAPPVKRSRMNTLDKYFSGGCDADNCEVKSKRRKQEMTDETTERESVQCPVCSQYLLGDNVLLNQHIDECLNISAINNDSFN